MRPLRLSDIGDAKLRKKLMEAGTISPEEAKKEKTRRRDLEAIEQQRVVAWARQNEEKYPALHWLHASANGSQRDSFTAYLLKLEGVLAGVPDLFLPLPVAGYHGLYIEMKSSITGGTPSTNQIKFMNFAASVGYCVALSYDAEPAKRLLRWYVKGAAGPPPIPLWEVMVS